MSHLIHVLDFKKYLTEQGVTCPIEQSKLLAEPFTRALIRHAYRCGGDWNQAVQDRVWVMLEKWNKVSPIPASQINQMAQVRINGLRGAMINTGTLPCKSGFTTMVGDVDIGASETCQVLVNYLVKELESGNE